MGRSRALDLAVEQARFDLRLAGSFVAFVTGVSAASAFGWVPQEQARVAGLAGFHYKPEALGSLDIEVEKALRLNAGRGVWHVWSISKDPASPVRRDPRRAELVRDFLNDQLNPLQVVSFWRVSDDSNLVEASIPRLDSYQRCVAYIIGLMLLDRHHLRRGIKICRMRQYKAVSRTDGIGEARQPGDYRFSVTVGFHIFLDVPNSKRLYCCTKHSQTDRKRRQRQSAKAPPPRKLVRRKLQ